MHAIYFALVRVVVEYDIQNIYLIFFESRKVKIVFKFKEIYT